MFHPKLVIFIQYLLLASSDMDPFIFEKQEDSQRLYVKNEQTLPHKQNKKQQKNMIRFEPAPSVFHTKTPAVVLLFNH